MKMISLNDGRQLIIRDAVKSDADEMINYMNDISKETDNLSFGEGEFGKSVEEEAQHIESCLQKDNAIFIVAVVDGEIVGHLSFEGGYRKRTRHTGEFGIAIRKEFCGIGIGSILIQQMINWAKQGKIVTKINLRVRTVNTGAIKLYEKMGFKHEGKIARDLLVKGIYYDSYYMGMEID